MKLIEKVRVTPKKLILLDGCGSLFSAFILGFLFVQFESLIGIPRSTLYVLAILPIIFCICDFYIYFRNINIQINDYLNTIASMNLLYCLCSLCLLLYHSDKSTSLGLIYVVLEILIITLLAIIERKIAKELVKS